MAYTISGPSGELSEDGTDAKFFELVWRHKLPCPRLKMLYDRFYAQVELPASDLSGLLEELLAVRAFYRSLNEPAGITARDPQVRERIVAAKMSGDPVDAFAARFIELTEEALEQNAPMTFCGD